MSSNKPYIICHMLSTIDGKITFGKINGENATDYIFGEEMTLYNITQEKLNTRAILCGRVTMNDFAEAVNTPLDEFKDSKESFDSDFVILNDKEGYFIVVDTKGLLRWKDSFITLSSEHLSIHKWNLLIMVTNKTPKEYLAYLKSKGISYVFCGDAEIEFEKALIKLSEMLNLDKIVLEGGGSINGSIIDDELIDEISLLYVPIVINNTDSPALFNGIATKFKVHKFKLKNVEKLDNDILWLRYVKA